MTNPTPAQSDDEAREQTEKRLGGDLQFGGTVLPAWHTQPVGEGRWFPLFAHGEPLGYVWTNDRDGLGFIPTSDLGITRVPEFVLAFRAAYRPDEPPTRVFDHWAGYAALGLQAGPVEHGRLDTLTQRG
jgi:hypothetical protein